MKLELERQDFLKAWQTAGKFANTKTPKDSVSGVLITASDDNTVILEATDLRTSIRCQAKGVNVLEPGTAVIPAVMFGDMLRKLSADDLVLEVNSERAFLNAGSQKMRFTAPSTEEFPKIPESSGAEAICEITSQALGKLIAEGSAAASQPQDFPKYLGTCLLRTSEGMLIAVSTDGKRLSLAKSPCSASKDDDLLLPAPALRELGKTITNYADDDTVKVFADGSTVWFGLEGIEFSIRRVESAFPRFERILNTDVRTTLRIQAGELLSALERIDIIAKGNPGHIMAMALQTNGELRITARAPELGTAVENLMADITGSYLHLGFNVEYFTDGLKALGAGEASIEFSDEEGQARMKRADADDFLYMLMPARLSQQDAMTAEEIGDFSGNNTEGEPADIPEQEQEQSQELQEGNEGMQDVQETSGNNDEYIPETPF